jgi:hypothetical protein
MVNKEPEPLVVVDQLSNSVILRIYFWYDATQYAPIKIKSSILRLVKRGLQDANISIPDEAREIVFPNGIPIVQVHQPEIAQESNEQIESSYKQKPKKIGRREPVTTAAEGDGRPSEQAILELAEHARALEEGDDLLDDD